MDNHGPVHRAIQNYSIYFQGVCHNNSTWCHRLGAHRGDAVIVLKRLSGSVALVHVEVYHEHALQAMHMESVRHRHRNVILHVPSATALHLVVLSDDVCSRRHICPSGYLFGCNRLMLWETFNIDVHIWVTSTSHVHEIDMSTERGKRSCGKTHKHAEALPPVCKRVVRAPCTWPLAAVTVIWLHTPRNSCNCSPLYSITCKLGYQM